MIEISVKDFAAIQNSAFVLDVREGWELKKAALVGVFHCPLSDLIQRKGELPTDRPIYVLCHHGVRSLKVTLYLQGEGYEAINIKGGIDAYARDIDASVGFY